MYLQCSTCSTMYSIPPSVELFYIHKSKSLNRTKGETERRPTGSRRNHTHTFGEGHPKQESCLSICPPFRPLLPIFRARRSTKRCQTGDPICPPHNSARNGLFRAAFVFVSSKCPFDHTRSSCLDHAPLVNGPQCTSFVLSGLS